ncbi:hypothetical protein V6D40_05615 [Corynebacterium sp. Q4381]|uniref:hypothetical protein n=1 Tax=Corynebacterium sp. Marseille-Q4381 TaxID=3121597 RepID=UPI002FE64465
MVLLNSNSVTVSPGVNPEIASRLAAELPYWIEESTFNVFTEVSVVHSCASARETATPDTDNPAISATDMKMAETTATAR